MGFAHAQLLRLSSGALIRKVPGGRTSFVHASVQLAVLPRLDGLAAVEFMHGCSRRKIGKGQKR